MVAMPSSSSTHGPDPKIFPSDRKRFQHEFNPLLPVLILDEDGHLRHMTPAARHLLEMPEAQAPPSMFFHLIHPGHLYPVMRDVTEMVLHGRKKASWMLRLRSGRRMWKWVRITAHNHLNEPEEAIVLHLRELT